MGFLGAVIGGAIGASLAGGHCHGGRRYHHHYHGGGFMGPPCFYGPPPMQPIAVPVPVPVPVPVAAPPQVVVVPQPAPPPAPVVIANPYPNSTNAPYPVAHYRTTTTTTALAPPPPPPAAAALQPHGTANYASHLPPPDPDTFVGATEFYGGIPLPSAPAAGATVAPPPAPLGFPAQGALPRAAYTEHSHPIYPQQVQQRSTTTSATATTAQQHTVQQSQHYQQHQQQQQSVYAMPPSPGVAPLYPVHHHQSPASVTRNVTVTTHTSNTIRTTAYTTTEAAGADYAYNYGGVPSLYAS